MTAGGSYLIPADEEQLRPLINAITDSVIGQLCMNAETATQNGWTLPAELTDPAVNAAWSRVYDTIRAVIDAGDGHQILGPAGNDLMPLALVDIEEDDLSRLRAVDVQLQAALAAHPLNGSQEHRDIGEILYQLATWDEDLKDTLHRRDLESADVAGLLHQLLDVLALSDLEQAKQIRSVLAAGTPPIGLDVDGYTAYRELAMHFITLLGGGAEEAYVWLG